MSIEGINSFGASRSALTNDLLAGVFGVGFAGRAGLGFSGRIAPIQGIGASGTSIPFGRPGPLVTPAYQRSVDGDEAFLGSRLASLSYEEQQAVTDLAAGDAGLAAQLYSQETNAPLSDDQGDPEPIGGGSGEPIDTGSTGDPTSPGGEIEGSEPSFEQGSANAAFNRASFPGQGHAYGHFKSENNPNAILSSAHGFAFGADPLAGSVDGGDEAGQTEEPSDVVPVTDEPVGVGPPEPDAGAAGEEEPGLPEADGILDVGGLDLVA